MKKTNPVSNQHGFTLIEIIAVLIILGILAAVAVPKYIDLTDEANESAVKAQAASLSSASAMNYAKFKLGANTYTTIDSCEDATELVEDWDSEKFTFTPGGNYSAGFTLLSTESVPPAIACSVYTVD